MPSCLSAPDSRRACLLGAQVGVAGGFEGLVERGLEVADVVHLADRRGVRFEELGDQVLAADLDRVLADLECEEVHRPFDRSGRLGPTGTAVGGGRRRVGDDRRGADLHVRDVVHTRRHRAGHERGEDRAHADERAGVLDRVQLVVGDLAVTGAADRDVLELGAAVAEAHHRLAAGFAPAHRAAELLRERAEQEFFGVGVDLGAEAAADVGGDQVDRLGVAAVGCGERVLRSLGALAGDPLDEPAAVPRGRRGAHFERAGGDALVHEPAGDGDLAVGEELVGRRVLGDAERRRVEHGVAAGGLVDQRLGRERFLEVDECGQELVVDEHHLGGVGRLLLRFGDDDGDRFADVADLVAGEQGPRRAGVERRGDRFEAERFGGVDRQDAGHLERATRCRSTRSCRGRPSSGRRPPAPRRRGAGRRRRRRRPRPRSGTSDLPCAGPECPECCHQPRVPLVCCELCVVSCAS